MREAASIPALERIWLEGRRRLASMIFPAPPLNVKCDFCQNHMFSMVRVRPGREPVAICAECKVLAVRMFLRSLRRPLRNRESIGCSPCGVRQTRHPSHPPSRSGRAPAKATHVPSRDRSPAPDPMPKGRAHRVVGRKDEVRS